MPCSVFTVPLPTFIGELYTAPMSSRSNPIAGADDVADGIHRAHFVEMDLFDRNIVNLGFRLAETLKHRGGVLFGAIGDAGVRDDFENVLQMPMGLTIAAVFAGNNAKLRGRDAAPLGLLHFEPGARAERFERLHKLPAVGARVDAARQPSCLR